MDVFDTATNQTLGGFQVTLPNGIAFDPAGTAAFIAEGISPGNIVAVDTSTFLSTRIPVGNLPHSVAVDPSGHHVFVTNVLSNSISMINMENNKVRTFMFPSNVKHPLGITFIR